MKYISLEDLSRTVRSNLDKLPRDVDFVVGVPRSGMIAASYISTILSVPLIDVNSLAHGCAPSGGKRLAIVPDRPITGKVLVVEDSVSTGAALLEVKEKLMHLNYEFIYLTVYIVNVQTVLDRPDVDIMTLIDIYLEDLRNVAEEIRFEWDLLTSFYMSPRVLYDLDGVLCKDPGNEDGDDYLQRLKEAKPFLPLQMRPMWVVSYRIEKYKEETVEWLKKHYNSFEHLFMYPVKTLEERTLTPAEFKAKVYALAQCDYMFVADGAEAQQICELANNKANWFHKKVYSLNENKIYQ